MSQIIIFRLVAYVIIDCFVSKGYYKTLFLYILGFNLIIVAFCLYKYL